MLSSGQPVLLIKYNRMHIYVRVLQKQGQGALLDLGGLGELHVVDTLEQVLVAVLFREGWHNN